MHWHKLEQMGMCCLEVEPWRSGAGRGGRDGHREIFNGGLMIAESVRLL